VRRRASERGGGSARRVSVTDPARGGEVASRHESGVVVSSFGFGFQKALGFLPFDAGAS